MGYSIRGSIRTTIALALGLFVSAAAIQPVMAQNKTYTLKYHHSYPPSLSFYNKVGAGFIARVQEWSNGRIKFQVFEAGALTSVAGQTDAVHKGIIDVSQSWGGFYVGTVPEADIETGLPLAWREPFEVYDAYYNRGLRDVIAKAYESKFNVKHFPAIIGMQYAISTSKPVKTLDDLKGMKLRAIGVYGEFARALGASATVVPGAELYTALQLGTVDGLIYDAEAIIAQGLQGFLKSSLIVPQLNAGSGHWLINKKTWDSLPPDLQKVIADAAQYGNMASASSYRANAERSVGQMRDKGVDMVTLTAADQKRANDVAQELWTKVASRSELAAKGVEIIRQQQKDFGR